MDRRIETEIYRLGSRFRRRAFALLLGCSWAGLAIAFWIGFEPLDWSTSSWTKWDVFGLVGFSAIVSIIGAWILTRFAYRNPRKLTEAVEARFPSLDRRLSTSLNLASSPEPQTTVFSNQLTKETLNHAQANSWLAASPGWTNTSAWIFQFTCLGIFATLIGSLLIGHNSSGPASSSTRSAALLELTIEPGSTEIEKGRDLVVTARVPSPTRSSFFSTSPKKPDALVENCFLEIKSTDDSAGSLPDSRSMRRAMSDPIYSVFLKDIESAFQYRVSTDSIRSDWYTVDVFTYPELLRSDVTISPPEYLGEPDKLIEDTRRISVLEGSTVRWRLNLNKPVQSVRLANEKTTLDAEASQQSPADYFVEWTASQTSTWSVELLDNEGRQHQFETRLSVRVSPNLAPELAVRGGDQVASPIEEITLAAKLSDDLGLIDYGLTYMTAGEPPVEIQLTSDSTNERRQEPEYLLALEELQVAPGDVLSYHFWAIDTDSNGNPRRVESDLFFVEVRPFDQIFRKSNAGQQADGQQQQEQQSGQPSQQSQELAKQQKQILLASWNIRRRLAAQEDQSTESMATDIDAIRDAQQANLEKLQTMQSELQDPMLISIADKTQESMQTAINLLDELATETSIETLNRAIAAEQESLSGILRLQSREVEVSQQQSQQSSGQQSSQNMQQQIDELELDPDANRYEQESQAAAEKEDEAAREERQIVNRLEELAQRQKEINEQIQETMAALEAAENEDDEQAIRDQLDRLREAQQEALRDADELLDRMDESESSEAMEQAQQELEQTRQDMQKSAESLQESQPDAALSPGSRAEQSLAESTEELRKNTTAGFERRLSDLVEKAKEVEQAQQSLLDKFQNKNATDEDSSNSAKSDQERNETAGLRSDSSVDELTQAIDEQQQRLDELTDQMQETTSDAESLQPLLAEELYRSFRDLQKNRVEEKLDNAELLIENGLRDPAQSEIESIGETLKELREQIESAAGEVIGSDTESLERAVNNLQRAEKQIASEQNRLRDEQGDASAEDAESETTESPNSAPGESGESAQSENAEGGKPGDPNADESPNGESPNGESPNGESPDGESPDGGGPDGANPASDAPTESTNNSAAGQPSNGDQPPSSPAGGSQPGQGSLLDRFSPNSQSSGTGGSGNENSASAPLTGGDYGDFSDTLRDVEELVRDPELRSQAKRIREAAKDLRKDFKKNGTPPKWDLVEKLISNPLRTLRTEATAELLRRTADQNSLVPIDRDAVPARFQNAVNKYYESLGSQER
jgi:hypothetical protein